MQFGDYRVEIIPDAEFHLDGGAMFGVVPRNLWSRVCPPDDENRIRMNMNCLFVETTRERIRNPVIVPPAPCSRSSPRGRRTVRSASSTSSRMCG